MKEMESLEQRKSTLDERRQKYNQKSEIETKEEKRLMLDKLKKYII